MKYSIGQKAFDRRLGQNFLIVDAETADETVVYTLSGGLGTPFEQMEDFLESAKRGRGASSKPLKSLEPKLRKSAKQAIDQYRIYSCLNGNPKGKYELLPTPSKLKDMEMRLERAKKAAILQASKTPKPRDTMTLATWVPAKLRNVPSIDDEE